MEAKTLTPTRYIIIGTGEGASVQVVTSDIHQAVHDSFCSCELPWEQCATEFIKEDVRRLDNPDEWATDEDGREFSMAYEGEQYSLTVYKDWNSTQDTAKEQAGRKMFEALGIAQEVLSGTASRLSVHGLTHIEIDEVGKRINAALAAGREAGWGQ